MNSPLQFKASTTKLRFLSLFVATGTLLGCATPAVEDEAQDPDPVSVEVDLAETDTPENPFEETAELSAKASDAPAGSLGDAEETIARCDGYRYGREGYPQDYDKAFQWCVAAAEQGHPVGQSILGGLYYNGYGTERSYKDALYWFTLAANRRMAHAAYSLYFMYFTGQGTDVDYQTAFMYLDRASELGNEQAKEVFSNPEDNPPPVSRLTEDEIKQQIEEHGAWKIAPIYPRIAQYAGLEGYVIVEYCIDKEGRTTNFHITHSVPTGVFDAAALAAAKQFRYRPKMLDDVPVERHGVSNKFTFELNR
ncbi:TonB family protein [Halioglobus maricola]|uniref:TonB family protein n=1 Tax=Halioglobus maricola TaxID=2601894 RepID=A0A5P9NHT2_9GAMM|nr:TonB family protein [Halioglobus maricola]QFU75351.1 TonB family protein [Halioglobus maricola]